MNKELYCFGALLAPSAPSSHLGAHSYPCPLHLCSNSSRVAHLNEVDKLQGCTTVIFFLTLNLNSHLCYFREAFPNNELWKWLTSNSGGQPPQIPTWRPHVAVGSLSVSSSLPAGVDVTSPGGPRLGKNGLYHWSRPWGQIQWLAEKWFSHLVLGDKKRLQN